MQNHFDAEEAKRRLAHLAAMPETTSRRCEMAALRNVLEMGAGERSKARGRRTSMNTRRQQRSDVPDEPEKSSREVIRTSEGRKKVVIRKKTPEKKPLQDDDRDDRERIKRVNDFGKTLKQGF